MATRRTSLADLQQYEAALKNGLAKKKQALALKQAEIRNAEQKARNRQRFLVGRLVLDLPPLARLTAAQLQEALSWLAWCVEDEDRWRRWRRESQAAAAPGILPCAPGIFPCSFTTISGEIRETSTNGSRT
jgi:hypothetical protein